MWRYWCSGQMLWNKNVVGVCVCNGAEWAGLWQIVWHDWMDCRGWTSNLCLWLAKVSLYYLREKDTLSFSPSHSLAFSPLFSLSCSLSRRRLWFRGSWGSSAGVSEYITCALSLSQWTKGFYESYRLTHWIINVTHVWSPDYITKSCSSFTCC